VHSDAGIDTFCVEPLEAGNPLKSARIKHGATLAKLPLLPLLRTVPSKTETPDFVSDIVTDKKRVYTVAE
jgi:hypothetical protein